MAMVLMKAESVCGPSVCGCWPPCDAEIDLNNRLIVFMVSLFKPRLHEFYEGFERLV